MTRIVHPTLTKPQARFLQLPYKFRAYVGGLGSGKTWAGAADACSMAWNHPRVNTGYFGPTYSSIKDVYFPTIEEVAANCGLNVDFRKGDMEVDFYSGRSYRSTVICRSMKIPESIVGFKIAKAQVDELDTIPKDKAVIAWRNIIARMRINYDGINGVNVTTTPEGFAFVYDMFVRKPEKQAELKEFYGYIQASTYDNERHLPADYIPSLYATYPANLVDAYLLGKFVPLKTGRVYADFSRKENGSTERISLNEPLYIGMDFNIDKMAAIVFVKRNGQPHAVDEIVNEYDTASMIKAIQKRFWTESSGRVNKQHQIFIYPDPSGQQRRSSAASNTDISLLKDAGFVVRALAASTGGYKTYPVRDRINSVNAMILNAEGSRRLRVNIDACPTLVECLEQQPYDDKGDPDKKQDLDHPNDALGYFITYEYPIRKPVTHINLGVAM